MPNNPEMIVNDALCRARVKANEQRIDKLEEKIERHETTMVGVAECLAKLTALYEVSTEKIDDACTRVHALELRPVNRWEKILTGILSGGGGAVLGALLMQIFGG